MSLFTPLINFFIVFVRGFFSVCRESKNQKKQKVGKDERAITLQERNRKSRIRIENRIYNYFISKKTILIFSMSYLARKSNLLITDLDYSIQIHDYYSKH